MPIQSSKCYLFLNRSKRFSNVTEICDYYEIRLHYKLQHMFLRDVVQSKVAFLCNHDWF